MGGPGRSTWEPGHLPPGRVLEVPHRGEVFVRDSGEQPGRPTVLLLHGLAATGDVNWYPAFEMVERHGRVVSVDHRGHGRGIRHDDKRFRLAHAADDVDAVCEMLGLGPVIAVGYSMGGPIAQLLWHRHPERVAGLVLCATARSFGPRQALVRLAAPGAFAVLRRLPRGVRESLRTRLVGNPLAGDPREAWFREQSDLHDHDVVLDAARAITRFSSKDWIGGVDVPTAVVVTTRDELVPPYRQRGLAAAIDGASVHEADAGHLDCSLAPDEFVRALDEALGSVVDRL